MTLTNKIERIKLIRIEMKYNNDMYDKQIGEFYTKCCHNCQTHVVPNEKLRIANYYWEIPALSFLSPITIRVR